MNPKVYDPVLIEAECPSASKYKVVNTCCRACSANCGVRAHVRNGRVIKLEGDPEDPMSKGRLCPKGLAGIQSLYHPGRNKYPLIRAGKRGENKWRRATWDEALDYIAQRLMEIRARYGAESVVCSTGGGGNPQIWSIARFCNIFGTPNWFEPGCAQCFLPRELAYNMMYGGAPSITVNNSTELYFKDTAIQTLVLWGVAPSCSSPACAGGAVSDLRARGVKTIVIDPRMTPDAAKADIWLPVRPGSDVALLLCWIRYIMEHNLFDEDFVLKWTNLPYLVDVKTHFLLREKVSDDPSIPDTFVVWDENSKSVKPLNYPWNDGVAPALRGTFAVDGRLCKTGYQLLWERVEPYTLEKTAELCWLDAEKIEAAVRLYAENKPSGIGLGVATDQGINSVQAAMAVCTLDMLMGNVERPGALPQRFHSSGVVSNVPIADWMLPEEQLKKRLGGNEYKGLHFWHAAHPGSIRDAMITGKPYPIKAWIDRSGNKLGVVADSQSWLPALENLDLIVHMFTFPTSFSVYADVLLPATEWLETNMIVESCNKLMARQATTHLWETMDETLFWSKLAKKCANLGHERCESAFDPDYMGKDLAYWDTMEEFLSSFTMRIGLTWEQFQKKAPFEYLSREEWQSYYVYLQTDPDTGSLRGFNTPSKKIELYLEQMITLGRTGKPFSLYELPPASREYDPLPYYCEPCESPIINSGLTERYPLVLTSGRIPIYHHSTLRNVAFLREIYPAPELWIHPNAAKKYGVIDGQWIWVESQRGRTRAVALVTEGINPGVVCMERFWNPEKLGSRTHGWQEMNVNLLTRADGPYNDVVGGYTLRACAVKVYPAQEGAPEGIWIIPEHFKC